MHKIYFSSHDEEENSRKRYCSTRWEKKHTKDGKSSKYQNTVIEADPEWPKDLVNRDLFIWALLMNRVQMARVFLTHMKHRTCAALIGNKIMKEFSTRIDRGQERDKYKENAKYFEQYAIECINKCEQKDVDAAPHTLLYPIELYGYVSCLQVSDLCWRMACLTQSTRFVN
jgi:hypothetical protein